MKQADGHGNRMTFVHKFIFRTKKLVGKMSGRAVSHHLVRPRSPCTSRSGGCRARAACPRPYAPTRSPTAMEDRRRATPIQSRQRTMPRHAHARRGRETERRIGAPPFLIFFWTVRLTPNDRNRLNARATQSGLASGVLADAPAASAIARPNGPKEKKSFPSRSHHERHRHPQRSR